MALPSLQSGLMCKGHDKATCPKKKYHIRGLIIPVRVPYYGCFRIMISCGVTYRLILGWETTLACSKCLNGVRHSASDPTCPWQKSYQTNKGAGIG